LPDPNLPCKYKQSILLLADLDHGLPSCSWSFLAWCGDPILNKRATKSKHQDLWMTGPSRIKTNPLWNIQPTCNTMDVTVPSPRKEDTLESNLISLLHNHLMQSYIINPLSAFHPWPLHVFHSHPFSL
jgi:hypothetical protein